jgi:hypothetical protein
VGRLDPSFASLLTAPSVDSPPIPSHQTTKLPPTPSNCTTSPRLIRNNEPKYCILTVIQILAIIPRESQALSLSGDPVASAPALRSQHSNLQTFGRANMPASIPHSFALFQKMQKINCPIFIFFRTLQKRVFQQPFSNQQLPHSFAKHRGCIHSTQYPFPFSACSNNGSLFTASYVL